MERKFRKYYEMKTVETEKGPRQTAVYTGGYYRFDIPDTARRRAGILFLSLSVLQMASLAAAGMLNGVFSRTFYIALPYAFQFLPAMFLLPASAGFLRARGDLTVPAYLSTFRRIGGRGAFSLALAAATGAGSLATILSGRFSPGVSEAAFLLLTLLNVAFMTILLIIYSKMQKKVKFFKDNQTDHPGADPAAPTA